MGGQWAIIESDLHETLEGDFGLPVEITNPAGVTQIYSANDPTELLSGKISYSTVMQDPETGAPIIDPKPVVTLRRSSLDTVPDNAALGNWMVRIPITPSETGTKVTYTIGQPTQSSEIGMIRLYLTRIVQSS
jgi:hypothetical protein